MVKKSSSWRSSGAEDFPRNRFAKNAQYLHLSDKRTELPRGHENHEKLFKVRRFSIQS